MDVTFAQNNGYEDWTFVKYTKRASKEFIDFDRIFSKQTKRYRYLSERVIDNCFNKALAKYGDAI